MATGRNFEALFADWELPFVHPGLNFDEDACRLRRLQWPVRASAGGSCGGGREGHRPLLAWKIGAWKSSRRAEPAAGQAQVQGC